MIYHLHIAMSVIASETPFFEHRISMSLCVKKNYTQRVNNYFLYATAVCLLVPKPSIPSSTTSPAFK